MFKCVAVIAAAGAALVASPADAVELFVGPQGSGSQCSIAHPCGLGAAQITARRAAVRGREDVNVNLLDGVYDVSVPIRLTGEDSPRGPYKLRLRAAPGAHPVLSGGHLLHDWRPAGMIEGRPLFRVRAPASAVRNGRTLFVDGHRAERGRTQLILNSDRAKSAYFVTGGAIDLSRFKNVTDIESVELENEFEVRRCKVRDATPARVGVGGCLDIHHASKNHTGYFENAFELMRAPGQWYFDRTGAVSASQGGPREPTIYYVAHDGEKLSGETVWLGDGGTFIDLRGTPARPVHDVEIQGLTFAFTSWDAVERADNNYGYSDLQTGIHQVARGRGFFEPAFSSFTSDGPIDAVVFAAYPAGAIQLNYARNVAITGNAFEHLGTWGVVGVHGVQQVQISRNRFEDLSGGGVSLGGIEFQDHHPCGDALRGGPCNSPTMTADDAVTDNFIHEIGREYFGSVGIAAYNVSRTRFDRNQIRGAPYSGIALGLSFGQTEPRSAGGIGQLRPDGTRYFYKTLPVFTDNSVSGNRVEDYQRLLSDGGGFYSNGFMGRTAVKANLFRFRGGRSAGIWGSKGVYLDEGSQGLIVTDNVVHGATVTLQCNSTSPGAPRNNQVHRTYGDADTFNGRDCIAKGLNPAWDPPVMIGPSNISIVTQIEAQAGVGGGGVSH